MQVHIKQRHVQAHIGIMINRRTSFGDELDGAGMPVERLAAALNRDGAFHVAHDARVADFLKIQITE